MSSKRERQTAILEVIREHRVGSQEALRERLLDRGIEVTQATVSRDVRDLRLVKAPDAEGAAHYTLPEEWENTPPLERLLPTLYQSAEGTRNLLIVRTMTGGAQAVALAIDWEEWPEILGTIAGDDTILIICRQDDQVPTVHRRLDAIAGTSTD
jgi:transcriptional regulator of arginine metabolism